MDFMHMPKQDSNKEIVPGNILIAEPFLSDGAFSRTVVVICEHGIDGTIGFVFNKEVSLTLTDILPDCELSLKLYEGGPVQHSTLHMLHRLPIELGGIEVAPGIYWGGSFEVLQDMMDEKLLKQEDIKLFLGYSGWSTGQLNTEMNEGSWYVGNISQKLLFDTATSNIWKNAMISLGEEYQNLINLPVNPQLN